MRKLDLMIIGTCDKETGGIAKYAEKQMNNLPNNIHGSIYDIGSINDSGATGLIKLLLLTPLKFLLFPFQTRPDITHIHTSHYFSFFRAGIYVIFCSLIWRVPTIIHIHGSEFDDFLDTESRFVQWYQRIVFRRADKVIVLGEYWDEVFEGHVGEEKICVVPNAVNPGNFDPQYKTDQLGIVFVSDLVERKGVKEISEALRRVSSEASDNIQIDLAGKGALSDRFETLSEEQGSIAYHGYISESKKRELLDEAQIFLLPSYAEGLPIAMLEAMAGGNAVISTRVGSIPEVISEENGILINPGDSDELYHAIQALINDRNKCLQAGKTNRDLVIEEYSWETVMDEVVDCYYQVLDINQS